jgi:hypothetical protein
MQIWTAVSPQQYLLPNYVRAFKMTLILSLSLVKHNAMKMYSGMEIHAFWMAVKVLLYAVVTLFPVEEHPVAAR